MKDMSQKLVQVIFTKTKDGFNRTLCFSSGECCTEPRLGSDLENCIRFYCSGEIWCKPKEIRFEGFK